MSRSKVTVGYWADTELVFVPITRDRCEDRGIKFELVKVSHHPSWFSERRSRIANAMHLSKILLRLLASGFRGKVCAFGTNVCRIVFIFSWLFRRSYFVYNELPEYRPLSPLFWLDRAVFKYAHHIYVSTRARADFVRKLYGLSRDVGVLENIALREIAPSTNVDRENRLVFAGSITPKRFSPEDIEKFRLLSDRLGSKIVVYGVVARELLPEFGMLLDHRGVLSHVELVRRLQTFRYALLAYYQGEPNYELCAPLKLYEYIAAGCHVISVNRNQGLVDVAARYPNLISFVDDASCLKFPRDELAFSREREVFLKEAIQSNDQLSIQIVSDN